MGEYSTETRLFTWMMHTLDNHNASLSDVERQAFCTSAAKRCGEAVPRVSPTSPGAVTRRTRRVLVEEATRSFDVGAPPGRRKSDRQNDTFTLPFSGRSLHSDPFGKAEILTTWIRVVLLNPASAAVVLRASLSPLASARPGQGRAEPVRQLAHPGLPIQAHGGSGTGWPGHAVADATFGKDIDWVVGVISEFAAEVPHQSSQGNLR